MNINYDYLAELLPKEFKSSKLLKGKKVQESKEKINNSLNILIPEELKPKPSPIPKIEEIDKDQPRKRVIKVNKEGNDKLYFPIKNMSISASRVQTPNISKTKIVVVMMLLIGILLLMTVNSKILNLLKKKVILKEKWVFIQNKKISKIDYFNKFETNQLKTSIFVNTKFTYFFEDHKIILDNKESQEQSVIINKGILRSSYTPYFINYRKAKENTDIFILIEISPNLKTQILKIVTRFHNGIVSVKELVHIGEINTIRYNDKFVVFGRLGFENRIVFEIYKIEYIEQNDLELSIITVGNSKEFGIMIQPKSLVFLQGHSLEIVDIVSKYTVYWDLEEKTVVKQPHKRTSLRIINMEREEIVVESELGDHRVILTKIKGKQYGIFYWLRLDQKTEKLEFIDLKQILLSPKKDGKYKAALFSLDNGMVVYSVLAKGRKQISFSLGSSTIVKLRIKN